ncbi:hypothetical protein [Halobacterium yunchengense]|uniref:hypothetical protein n=1 Tax=Halobacterium yunchengense TaxID=3108497 RepID=UPI00300B5BB0
MPDAPSSPDDGVDRAPTDRDDGEPDGGSDPTEGEVDRSDGETDQRTAADAPSAPADSRWWYWVAAVPAFYVVATVAGFLFGALAFAFALTGAEYGPGIGAPVGLGFFGAFVLFAFLAAVGGLLSLVFPVAIYLDADAVAETPGDWQPDPELYGVLGLVGVVAQPLQAPLGVYYLYRRHQSEGVP